MVECIWWWYPQNLRLKGSCLVVRYYCRGGTPLQYENDLMISSHLLNRFFSPTPQTQARDQAVQKRRRNKESVEWLQRYCMIHSDSSSLNRVQNGHFAVFS